MFEQSDDDTPTASRIFKRAVQEMVDKGMPPTPMNYALWYTYVSTRMPTLNQELDQIIGIFNTCPPDKAQKLFKLYILGQKEESETVEQLKELTNSLFQVLTSSSSHLDDYGAALDENRDKLESTTDISELKDVIAKLSDATKTVSDANNAVSQQLKNAEQEAESLRKELAESQERIFIDNLTQLYNRAAFNKQLDQLLSVPKLAAQTCLIVVDIDHFKKFNDTYGHLVGDLVLKSTAGVLMKHSPENAIATRFGGEEFIVILNNSSVQQAMEVAEKLRMKIERLRVKLKDSDKPLDRISASFGVAQYIAKESREDLIGRADKALYAAKEGGRNQVRCAE